MLPKKLMPISHEALQSEKNRFIAVKREATVGQALAALKALGGQMWWHLVVQLDKGSWGVVRFSDLGIALQATANAAETRLGDLKELPRASAIERDSLDTKVAQTQARKSLTRVLVVTADGVPVGILVEGVRRGSGGLSLAADVDRLGGKYVKLKDYGSILLGSSKK